MTRLLRIGFGLTAAGAGAIAFLFGQEFFLNATPGCCEADDQMAIAALTLLYLFFAFASLVLSFRQNEARDHSALDHLLFGAVSLAAFVALGFVVLEGFVPILAGPSVVALVCLAIQFARYRNRKASGVPTP